jgi:hypothetical protein
MTMRLTTNIHAGAYEIGDEIWHATLPDALRSEAENTVHHLPAILIRHVGHDQLVDLIAQDMAEHLRTIGDTYTAIDGVIYTLRPSEDADTLTTMPAPTAVEATFHQTPYGPRTATVRWSDGTTSDAIRFYPDEILISEGDLIGKTQEQIRSLHHRRDRDWLQS